MLSKKFSDASEGKKEKKSRTKITLKEALKRAEKNPKKDIEKEKGTSMVNKEITPTQIRLGHIFLGRKLFFRV